MEAGAPSPPRAPARPCYPPSPLLEEAVAAIARLNGFSPSACRAGRTPPRRLEAPCAIAAELPSSWATDVGDSSSTMLYGRQAEGYVVVRPRPLAHTRVQAAGGWPLTPASRSAGGCEPCPMRLHRWLIRAETGTVVRHVCDNQLCIAHAHVLAGTHYDNRADRVRADVTRGAPCDTQIEPTSLASRSLRHIPRRAAHCGARP